MKIDVLCIGITAYDMVFRMPAYPAENSKIKVADILECGGGCAANAACLLAHWGVSTAFAGLVGADHYGDLLMNDLHTWGVNTDLVERRAGHPTPLSCILVNQSNASRTIINRRQPADGYRLNSDLLAAMSPDVILVDSHALEASLQAIEAFPAAKAILDAGTARDGAIKLAACVDYLVASQDFALQHTGMEQITTDDHCLHALRSCARIQAAHATSRQRQPGACVITLGERGVIHCAADGTLCHTPAIQVDAVDTTGAGDLFHGAFAYGLLQQWSLSQCIEIANHTAGISVTRRGGRSSIPSLEEVNQHLFRCRPD